MADWMAECDYCGREIESYATLRAIGFSPDPGEENMPLVKLYCGRQECEPTDQIDPEANAALMKSIG